MNTACLAIVTAQDIHLKDALAAFLSRAAEPAVALLYDPELCRFRRLEDDGRLTGPSGAEESLTALGRVFEARVFNDTVELRWVKDPAGTGTGRAAILNELEANTERSPQSHAWRPLEFKYAIVGTLKQTYLLWGEGMAEQLAAGWSTLATPRIGALPVPISGVGRNERVLLHTIEYLAEYEHGNVAVFDERLVKLEVERG